MNKYAQNFTTDYSFQQFLKISHSSLPIPNMYIYYLLEYYNITVM